MCASGVVCWGLLVGWGWVCASGVACWVLHVGCAVAIRGGNDGACNDGEGSEKGDECQL